MNFKHEKRKALRSFPFLNDPLAKGAVTNWREAFEVTRLKIKDGGHAFVCVEFTATRCLGKTQLNHV